MKEVFINGTFIVEDKKVNKLINKIKRIVKENAKHDSIKVAKIDLELEKGKYKAGRLFKSIDGGYWLVISVSDKLIYGRTSNDRHQPGDIIVTTPEGKTIIVGKDNIRNYHFNIINNNLMDTWGEKNIDDKFEYIMDLEPDVFEKFLISIG